MSKKTALNEDIYLSERKVTLNTELTNLEKKVTITTGGSAVKTGRIIDGKEEYVQRINLGTMPNSSSKNVTLPINLNNVLITRELHIWILSSYEYGAEPNNGVTYFISNNSLNITTSNDKSRFTGYCELYFIYK